MTDAYAAGLVDGEGTIYIDKNLAVRLEVQMAEKALQVLERLRDEYGGTVKLCRPETEKWAASYRWTQFSHEAETTLRRLLPHLRIKKQQATVALEAMGLKPRDKAKKWTQRKRQRAEVLRAEMLRLNRKGPSISADGTEKPIARLVAGTWVTDQANLFSDLGYETYSDRWPNSGFMTPHGVFATPGITEFPSDGGVSSSLVDVLVDRCAERFYLSPTAAAGILRRAGRRGRELPAHLKTALTHLASQLPSPKDPPSEKESATPDDERKTITNSSPPPSPPSGEKGQAAPPATSAKTSSTTSPSESKSTTEKPSKPSPPDSEPPESTTPMPKQDGSSPEMALFEMKSEPSKPLPTDTDPTPTAPPQDTSSPMAISENQRGELLETEYSHQLTGGGGKPGQGYAAVREPTSGVRRLTPTECERLQGFPDGWTVLDK